MTLWADFVAEVGDFSRGAPAAASWGGLWLFVLPVDAGGRL